MLPNDQVKSFWDHLESLRWTILRVIGVVLILMIFFFLRKDLLFDAFILPPLTSEFIFFHWLNQLVHLLSPDVAGLPPFKIQLINLDMTGQFMAHLTVSMSAALIMAVPYLMYEFWNFVAPALYAKEKKSVGLLFTFSALLFYVGALVSYFIILPLSVRFLGTYQVSELIPNQISLQSYLGIIFILIFTMGIMFELPILIYFLSRMGWINKQMLKNIRKYALLIILIIAAFITPTTDPFTMLLVALPLYLLYETGILVCRK